jgi:hypothetical protein
MATKSDTKKHLEEILGEKLGDEAVQLIQLVQSVALSTNTPGSTTQRHLLIARPNTCYDNHVLDVSGFATTASNGQSVFRLSSFLCTPNLLYRQPVNVVATPFSDKPFFLTLTQSLVNNGTDIEIKVFAWDANGAAAPNVTFNWRCRAELPIIIL